MSAREARRVIALLLTAGAFLAIGCDMIRRPLPNPTASPMQGYAPLHVAFDAGDSSTALATYIWHFDDGATAPGQTASHTFVEKGPHPVRLVVADDRGRVGEAGITIHVLNRVPDADFRYSPYGAPRDFPVAFDASLSEDPDGEIVSYSWDFGDGTTASGAHVQHLFPRSHAEYLVTLTVTDDDGAENRTARTVWVLGCDTCG